MRNAIILITTLSGIAMWITTIVFHLWTTLIAFTIGGFWGAMATLMIPGLSTLYWFITLFDITSAYTILGIVAFIFLVLSSFLDSMR